MPNENSSTPHVFRTAVLIFAGWFVFFGAQTLMSRTLSPEAALPPSAALGMDVTLAALWLGLNFAIVAWHRWLRVRVAGALALFGGHLPLAVVAALIDTAVTRSALEAFTGEHLAAPFSGTLVYYSDFDLVIYIAVVMIAEVLLVRRALAERLRTAERLEASLSRARLDYLEAQLQPHFLFNSLGAVSELAHEAPSTAARVLRQLSAIFRSALARKIDEITLGEEIVGIEPYLDIQRIRFADWLTIDYRIDDDAVDCLLPRFVLQPLIENAIRHGLSGRRAAGAIEISARVRNGSLVVCVADDGVGLEHASASSGRGIGLANVRDRLKILYGDDERLRLSGLETGGTIAELMIPARRRGDRAVRPLESGTVPSTNEDLDLPTLAVPALLRNASIASALIWLGAALIWTQQSFMYLWIRGQLGSATWLSIARVDLISAAVWAGITPIVMALAQRFPVRGAHVTWRVAAHLAGCGVVSFVHIAILHALTSPRVPLWSSAYQAGYAIGFVIALAIVAVAHRGVLVEWLRAREARSAALSAELDVARHRAMQLQSIPPVLLQSLDGIAAGLRQDPSVTEKQLTRLGDYVRLALECTDERGVTPERGRALDAAVAALRDSGAYSFDFTLSA